MIYPSKAVKGGRAFPDKSGIPVTYSDPSLPGSIRYFHKFDPVPGYYFGMMGWKHAPATAKLLYDYDAPCNGAPDGPTLGSSYVLADYGGTGSVASSVVGELYSFLCTSYGVATGSWTVTADPGTYFSYTNAINPAPCTEALISGTVEYMSTLPSVSVPSGTLPGIWKPYESFYECTISYRSSLTAYVGHYLTSQMGQIEDIGEMMWFYGFWGLWWIHSAYPNYDLDSSYGPQVYSASGLTVENPAEELGDLIMGNLPAFVESAYVNGDVSDVTREPSFCPWIRNLYYRYGGSRGRYSWLTRSRY